MQKRGQVAVFVVIGLVVLAVIFLLFFFKDSISKTLREEPANPQEYLSQQLNDIRKEVRRCVNSETIEASKLLMRNGGNIDRSLSAISYSGVDYPVLCKEFKNSNSCFAEPVLISNMNSDLNNYLPENVNKCMNLEQFRAKDYTLILGDLNLDVQIFDEDILVNVNLPVKLERGQNKIEDNSFIYRLNVPLGELTKAVNDLVQMKAEGKQIDVLFYSLQSLNKYNINVEKPYPDEVYDIMLTSNDEYHFYFAVEGSEEYERPEGRIA